jgi:cyclopropane fatty-acyl-phospholipid synthase-like methyltransferase
MNFANPSFFEGWLMDMTNYRFAAFNCKKYIESLPIQGDEQVLDFGCGVGGCAKYLIKRLNRGGRLTCVDKYEVLSLLRKM